MSNSTEEWYEIAEVWKQARIGSPQVVTNLGDLEQCIETILKTYPGQSCLRPIGSLIADHIDLPIDVARPLIIRDAVEAIALWEPRVELTRLEVTGNAIKGEIDLTVHWKVKNSEIGGALTLNLAQGAM